MKLLQQCILLQNNERETASRHQQHHVFIQAHFFTKTFRVGLAQWCGRSPSTNVSRVRIADPASYVD